MTARVLISSIVFCIAFVASEARCAPDPLETEYFDPGNAPTARVQEALYAIHNPTIFRARPTVRSGSDELAYPWRGNAPQLRASVESVSLRWSGVYNEDRQTELAVEVTFEDRTVIVRHDRAADKKMLGGVRLDLRAGKQAILIKGRKAPNLYVATAQSGDDGSAAVLLCARQKSLVDSAELQQEGDDLDLTLTAANFAVSASARAEINSSSGVCRGEAAVITTPNLRPAVTQRDDWYARYPLVVASYYPAPTEPQVTALNQQNNYAAVRSRVLLHSSAEYRLLQNETSALWVIKLKMTALPPPGAPASKKLVRDGDCYLLLKDTYRETEFTKEPLVLPESVQAMIKARTETVAP